MPAGKEPAACCKASEQCILGVCSSPTPIPNPGTPYWPPWWLHFVPGPEGFSVVLSAVADAGLASALLLACVPCGRRRCPAALMAPFRLPLHNVEMPLAIDIDARQ